MSHRLRFFALTLVLAGSVVPTTALASSPTTIIRQDMTGATVVCNGETLTVTSGTFQIVTHETATPSGAYHLIVEGNAQGVQARIRWGDVPNPRRLLDRGEHDAGGDD
jgi:hypothetical protein